MERSADLSDRPLAGPRVESPRAASVGTEAGDARELPVALLLLLAGEVAAFAGLVASGNMPQIVTVLYRALLTL